MSESDPSGYGDSPDTTDPAGQAQDSAQESAPDAGSAGGDATLTTDDEAQRDDTLERPGNEPD
jgi:hypothetical protein